MLAESTGAWDAYTPGKRALDLNGIGALISRLCETAELTWVRT